MVLRTEYVFYVSISYENQELHKGLTANCVYVLIDLYLIFKSFYYLRKTMHSLDMTMDWVKHWFLFFCDFSYKL